jgi:hypothetical protein
MAKALCPDCGGPIVIAQNGKREERRFEDAPDSERGTWTLDDPDARKTVAAHHDAPDDVRGVTKRTALYELHQPSTCRLHAAGKG